jgi:hypothetical protein
MNKRKAAMKINLNSDGQELHPFQQNEQLPLIAIHWTKKKPTAYDEGKSTQLWQG